MSFENRNVPNVRKKRTPCNKVVPPAYEMAGSELIESFQSRLVSPASRTASDDIHGIRNSIPDKSRSEKRHEIFKSFVRETVQSSSLLCRVR